MHIKTIKNDAEKIISIEKQYICNRRTESSFIDYLKDKIGRIS